MAYSIQTAVSDGTLEVLDLSIKYMDKSHIFVYVDDVLVDGSAYSYVWLTDTRIQIVPVVANGSTLKVIRKTLTDEMWHEFSKGARFSTESMDDNFEQLLFLAQEYSEGIYVKDFYTDIDMHLKRILNLADPLNDGDAVNFKTLKDYLPNAELIPPLVERNKQLLRTHFEAHARNIGCTLVSGSFETGATLTTATQLVLRESTATVYKWTGTLPKTIPTGSTPTEPAWVDVTPDSLYQMLAANTGAQLVGFNDESVYSYLTRNTVEAKLLTGSDKGAINKTILDAALNSGYNVVVNGTNFTINGPIDITKSNGVRFSGLGVCTLTKGVDQPLFRLYSNYAFVEGFDCAGYVAGTETTDTIIVGENDGANGQNVANGYKPCIRGRVKDVTILKSGRDGISWREGAFLDLDNVHGLDPARHTLYVDPKGFDNSHGTGTVSSAGAGDHGFYIGWGNHNFTLLKSFSDAKGVYINQSRGAQYNLFVELSGTAAVELGPDTLANDIALQFWTAGKNYIDNGIGNRITGMALGSNSGAITESFTRTNKLLINRAFTANGTSPLAGGLLIEQLSNNDFSIGDNAYTCKLTATPAGLALRDVACHSKVFDLSGFGSTQNLSNDNQHIDTFLLANGQTLQINGASGTGYIPFDGQTITVRLKGAGSVGINGQIAGSLQTVNLTTTNGFKRFKYIAAQGFWFEE